MLKVVPAALLGGSGAGALYLYLDDHQKLRRTLSAGYRVGSLVSCVGLMTSDYAYHYYWKQRDISHQLDMKRSSFKSFQLSYQSHLDQVGRSQTAADKAAAGLLANECKQRIGLLSTDIHALSEFRDADNRLLHIRNACRLRDMCMRNRGVYIKLGQHLAMLDHIMPAEYQDVLCALLDQNPTSSLASVERIFAEDFGATPSQLFDKFEPVPIASASLAQVHIAWKNGRKYAVKVQHEGLREGSAFDRLVITQLVDLMPLLFPQFRYSWLTKEMNKNIPMELDFRQERQNLEQARHCLADLVAAGDVAIPSADPALCSARVLTMSFEEGSYVNRLDGLSLNKVEIADLISRIFSEQIFRHGFVHCGKPSANLTTAPFYSSLIDPHEANLLVRSHPWKAGHPQVVLLDHGLYRRLDDAFRRDYCRLWQAIALSDEESIRYRCENMHAGAVYPLLVSMLTYRPWDEVVSDDADHLQRRQRPVDAVALRSYAHIYFQEIVELLGSVPSDLLLLFKTNDCLRHIDRTLGMPANSTTGLHPLFCFKIFSHICCYHSGGQRGSGCDFERGGYGCADPVQWMDSAAQDLLCGDELGESALSCPSHSMDSMDIAMATGFQPAPGLSVAVIMGLCLQRRFRFQPRLGCCSAAHHS